MAQDAPADTAGPSSPPPRLPEGWLPQWEGVQRQWYYVQRATGKSQWEIPTEPVVLTPSTTPTSIGTGPTQAPPSRPSTNSPQVTATGNSLVERMESAADRARISSSQSSQLNGQPITSIQGSAGVFGWHSLQNVQHGSQSYAQPFVPSHGGYAADQFHQTAPGNPTLRPTYTDRDQHPMKVHQQATWGSHTQMTQTHSSVPTTDTTGERYRNFAMESQQSSQMSAYGSSVAYPGNQHSVLNHLGLPSSQPQWQPEGHSTKSSHAPQPSSNHYSLSTLSQPFYGSSPISQARGQHPGELTSRPSQLSNPSHSGSSYSGNQEEIQHPRGSLSAHSYADKDQATSVASLALSRSQSHQSAGLEHHQLDGLAARANAQPSLHDHGPQQSNAQNSYHSTDMSRMQPNPGFNSMGFPAAPSTHGGAQHYQNPIVQAGVQHYLPPQPQSSTHNDAVSQHGAHYHQQSSQLPVHRGSWVISTSASRIASSDPQFVSGPWATSTPPTSGPPQQLHYG